MLVVDNRLSADPPLEAVVTGRFGELPGPAALRGGRPGLAGTRLPGRGSLEGSRSARVPVRCNLTVRCRGRLVLSGDGDAIGSSRLAIDPGKRKLGEGAAERAWTPARTR